MECGSGRAGLWRLLCLRDMSTCDHVDTKVCQGGSESEAVPVRGAWRPDVRVSAGPGLPPRAARGARRREGSTSALPASWFFHSLAAGRKLSTIHANVTVFCMGAFSGSWRAGLCAVAALVVAGQLAGVPVSAAPAVSAAPSVTRLADTLLDRTALYFVSYDGLVNNASYQQSAILSHRGFQYAAWY